MIIDTLPSHSAVMLSIACKRTGSVTRQHQGLRKTVTSLATSSVRRQQQQQQRARLTTESASSSASASKQQQGKHNPLVISRRAWLDFKESRGLAKKRPTSSSKPKSDDEKPWPRNMQIAGYVAGTLVVPYMMLWTITSNPTLREWFGPFIPLDKLRPYFGKLEWDAQSYSDEMKAMRKKQNDGAYNDSEESLIGYYQFPEEASFHERQQQEIVEATEKSDVAVTISLSSSTSSTSPAEEIVTTTIAAKTIANANNLLQFFPSASASTNTTVAVDFLDQNNQNDDGNNADVTSGGGGDVKLESISDGALMTDAESVANDQGGYKGPSDLSSASRLLAKATQTMSTWTYVPRQQQASGEASQKGGATATASTQMTDVEMKMGRLEYVVSELEKSLRDPMCTRNIDDMTTELRQAKRELSKLKWKRRFGFSR